MHLPSIGLILPLLSPRQTTPAFEDYVPCAQTCADKIADTSGCPLLPEATLIGCLCHDALAQTQLAQSVYTSCGAATLNETAATHDYNCQINGTPSVLTESQFIAAGEGTGSSSSPSSVGLANSMSSTVAIQMSTSSHTGSIPLTSASLASGSTATGAATPTSTPIPTTTPSTSSSGGGSSGSGGGSNRLSTASTVCAIIFPALTIIVTIVLAWIKWKQSKAEKEKEKEKSGDSGNNAGVIVAQ